ncbi:MAG: hypothetical protein KBT36_12710 [Kurthia sp.]|nr:hypothetical protein [Candidatus Kurthia equi]
MKNCIKFIMSLVLCFSLFSLTDAVQAKSYSSPKAGAYWKGYKKVKLKRNLSVYKMQKGKAHYQDRRVKKYTLKKNSYVYVQAWCMSCGGTFVVKTAKLKPTKKTYYQTSYYDMKAKFWY